MPGGTDYAFRLDGGEPLRRPALAAAAVRARRREPDLRPLGVRLDRRALARRAARAARSIYELHVGTFTPEGTLDAAIERLDYLAALGVTVVELMPLAAFPGEHGWGYDGIGLWAVHEPYGGPDALKRFVDACHAAGSPSSSTSSTTTSARGTGSPRSGRTSPSAHDPVGAGGEPGPAGLGRGARVHRRATR